MTEKKDFEYFSITSHHCVDCANASILVVVKHLLDIEYFK